LALIKVQQHLLPDIRCSCPVQSSLYIMIIQVSTANHVCTLQSSKLASRTKSATLPIMQAPMLLLAVLSLLPLQGLA
jgi:hypothetical protein